jgi:hypothetical protein
MLSGMLAAHVRNITGYRAGVSSGSGTAPHAFRLPRSTYLVVLFLVFGTVPLAFTAAGFDHDNSGGLVGPPAVVGLQTLLLVIPVFAAAFIARTATFVDDTGIQVRAVFGSRRFGWDDVRGLSVDGRGVYAVTSDGSWRLPCVHVNDLAAVSRASGGRLPEIANPKPKYAPRRRRRR